MGILIMYTSSHRSVSWEPLITALLALLFTLLMLAAGSVRGATMAAVDAPMVGKTNSLLALFLSQKMRGVDELVFAARGVNPTDGYWYANFGYYSHDPDRKAYVEGTKLYRFNLRTLWHQPTGTPPTFDGRNK
jgi:hypothetical protein